MVSQLFKVRIEMSKRIIINKVFKWVIFDFAPLAVTYSWGKSDDEHEVEVDIPLRHLDGPFIVTGFATFEEALREIQSTATCDIEYANEEE